jgi:hypothetical protein
VSVATQGESVMAGPDVTMARDDARLEASLRHLLQAADPIPRFREVPGGLDLRTFFERYLWRRGPRRALRLREDLFQTLEVLMRPFTEAGILAALRKVTLDRKREIRILSAFSDILEIVHAHEVRTSAARGHVEKVFLYTGLARFWCDNRSLRKQFAEYVCQPALLENSFTALTAALCACKEPCAASKLHIRVLAYGFLTTEFDFDEFRAHRPALAVFDAQIAQALASPAWFVDKQIPPPARPYDPEKFDKGAWLRAQLEQLKGREDLFEVVRGACCESSPLRKLEQLSQALGLARGFFSRNCPATTELGADEFTPIMISFLVLANPPHLMSNLVYIVDFCYSERFGSLFESVVVQPAGMLKMIVSETLPNFDLGLVTRMQFGVG